MRPSHLAPCCAWSAARRRFRRAVTASQGLIALRTDVGSRAAAAAFKDANLQKSGAIATVGANAAQCCSLRMRALHDLTLSTTARKPWPRPGKTAGIRVAGHSCCTAGEYHRAGIMPGTGHVQRKQH